MLPVPLEELLDEQGCHDVLLRELTARVRAVLRHAHRSGRGGPSPCGGQCARCTSRAVTVGEQRVNLTPPKCDVLATLMASPRRLFSRLDLLERLPSVAYEGYERTIDAHIYNLHTTIEPDPRHPRYVETIFGAGDRFACNT